VTAKLCCIGVTVATFVSACSTGEPSDPSSGARLALVVAHGRVELVSAKPIVRDGDAPREGTPAPTDLTWSFVASGGSVLARGAAGDPRLVHVEQMDGEAVPPGDLRAGAGAIEVEIPDVAGTLRVEDSAGQLLGTLAHERLGSSAFDAGLDPGKADINFKTDLIGTPVLLSSAAPEVTNPINLLFVPEGYRESELQRFHDDMRATVATLSTTDGYREHWSEINVWYQDIRSKSSGISDPARAIVRDTAFNITYGDGKTLPRKCLMPSNKWNATSVSNVARLAATTNADTVVVLANATERGGCSNFSAGFIVLSAAAAFNPGEGLAHELGHALFKLGDEYAANGNTSCDAAAPNLTDNLDAIPWQDLIAPETEIPTTFADPGTVGAFEGAGYCETGVYRPEAECRMRSPGPAFCAVCRREIERTFARRATAVRRATITNSTGADFWIQCDGRTGTAVCTGWTRVPAGASRELAMTAGRLIIDTTTIAGAPVRWSQLRIDAPSAAFSIFANADDPLSPVTEQPN